MERGDKQEKTSGGYGKFPQHKAFVLDERPDGLEYYAAMLKAYGYQVRRYGAYCEGRRFEKHGFVTVFGGSILPPPLPFSSVRTAAGVGSIQVKSFFPR